MWGLIAWPKCQSAWISTASRHHAVNTPAAPAAASAYRMPRWRRLRGDSPEKRKCRRIARLARRRASMRRAAGAGGCRTDRSGTTGASVRPPRHVHSRSQKSRYARRRAGRTRPVHRRRSARNLRPVGLSAIEAMACGTPVLTVNSSAVLEHMLSGGGFLFERGNLGSLADLPVRLFAQNLSLADARAESCKCGA